MQSDISIGLKNYHVIGATSKVPGCQQRGLHLCFSELLFFVG